MKLIRSPGQAPLEGGAGRGRGRLLRGGRTNAAGGGDDLPGRRARREPDCNHDTLPPPAAARGGRRPTSYVRRPGDEHHVGGLFIDGS